MRDDVALVSIQQNLGKSQSPRDGRCGWMKLVLRRTKFSGGSSRQSRIPANINKIIANSPGAYKA